MVSSKKNYLVAVYECMGGYILKDPMADRMFCSKGNWLGTMPECIKEGGKFQGYEFPEKNFLRIYIFLSNCLSIQNGRWNSFFNIELSIYDHQFPS